MLNKYGSILSTIVILTLFLTKLSPAQILDDPLQGNTIGTRIGGTYTSEGYKPGKGTNHILYTVPAEVANGYVEFEMKGFSPADFSDTGNDHAFLMMFDGRGIGSTPSWANFRDNYFRWNFHWRQSASNFKCVVNCAAPTSLRLNSTFAVFKEDMNGDGIYNINDRDWYDEPNGSSFSWDKNRWYTVKVEWHNKEFKAYVDGQIIWESDKVGLYDYNPVDFKIWLGSGVDKYDSDVNDVVYRNFKLFSLGGSSNFLAVSPSSRSVTNSAGNTTFSVSANVSWSLSDNADWISVNPSNGTNNSSLTATYDENTTSNSRTGTITVTGDGMTRNVTIVQAGASSSNYLDVSPTNKSVSASSGSTSFSISSDLSWTIGDNADWLSVSPTSGSGNEAITINYNENSLFSTRSALITISSGTITKTVTVNQAASTANSVLVVSPGNHNVSAAEGAVVFDIESNVSWSITDNTDWLIKSPKNGSGNGSFSATYSANPTSDLRIATISISGGGLLENVTITQSGLNPTITLIPAIQELADTADSALFVITSNVGWVISSDSDWLVFPDSAGSGTKSVNAVLAPNIFAEERNATITVMGDGIEQTAYLTQLGTTPSLDLSIDSLVVSDSAGTITFDFTANFNWKVESISDWLTVMPDSGRGDSTISVTFSENTDSISRAGYIVISGNGIADTVKIIQSGANFYTITAEVNPAESGTIEGTGMFLKNAEVVLTAIPNSGWQFDLWTENGNVISTDSIYVFNADSSRNLVAQLSMITSVNKIDDLPALFSLSPNYPNPFNPSTVIEYALPKGAHVQLTVYNLLGEKVRDLVNEFKSSGYHKINFNASNLPSGTYIYKIVTSNFTDSKKFILLK